MKTNPNGVARSLKIQSKLRECRRKDKHVIGYDSVPEIKLSGFWLEELGFLEGMRVLLITEKGSITLQVMA